MLNLLLLGGLIYAWPLKHGEKTVVVRSVKIEALAVPPVVHQTEPQPFRWSQLAASDYHVYVKNLREIGCPEATLRAIVTSDVDAMYRQRSRELEQKLDAIENSSWSVQLGAYHDQQALKAQMQKLPGEEYSEICDLLGLKPSPEPQVASVTVPSAVRHRQAPAKDHVMMPLVLQPVDVSALNLNDQQIQSIYELRQQFLDEIGGPHQDPGDPAYRERWLKAQPGMDDNLRGLLGMAAFENYQVAAQDQESPASQSLHP